jgi:hypothetical protein
MVFAADRGRVRERYIVSDQYMSSREVHPQGRAVLRSNVGHGERLVTGPLPGPIRQAK